MDNSAASRSAETIGTVVRTEALLAPIVQRQDGVVTTAQALGVGVTGRQLQALLLRGWSRPARGVYVVPHPPDAFRASVRAALLVCPDGAACAVTGARIHELWGLPQWQPLEVPQLLVLRGDRRSQRRGLQLRYGLEPQMVQVKRDTRVTRLGRTVRDLSLELGPDELVCLLDSALRLGWSPGDYALSRTRASRVSAALTLADARSESPLETRLRLVLVHAGLPPEVLQLNVIRRDGRWIARVDMAWPSRRLIVEADGREYHDRIDALHRDRQKQNEIIEAGGGCSGSHGTTSCTGRVT